VSMWGKSSAPCPREGTSQTAGVTHAGTWVTLTLNINRESLPARSPRDRRTNGIGGVDGHKEKGEKTNPKKAKKAEAVFPPSQEKAKGVPDTILRDT